MKYFTWKKEKKDEFVFFDHTWRAAQLSSVNQWGSRSRHVIKTGSAVPLDSDDWLSSISMRRRGCCCLIAVSMAVLLFIIFICGSISSHVSLIDRCGDWLINVRCFTTHLRVNITWCVFSFRNHRGVCLNTVVLPSDCYFKEYHSTSMVQVHKPWYYGGTMVNPGQYRGKF